MEDRTIEIKIIYWLKVRMKLYLKMTEAMPTFSQTNPLFSSRSLLKIFIYCGEAPFDHTNQYTFISLYYLYIFLLTKYFVCNQYFLIFGK